MTKEFEKAVILSGLNSDEYDTDEYVYTEVADNLGLKLYEFDREKSDEECFINEEDIHSLFPDAILKEGKGYLIGEGNLIYHN